MIIKFERRTDRPDAAGRCQIHLRAYFDGHRLRLSTAERGKASEWDAATGKFRRSLPGYQDANENLKAQGARVEAAYRHVRIGGGTPTPDTVRAALAELYAPAVVPPPPPRLLLVEEFDRFREVQRGRGMMRNTLRQYLVSRNWVARFEREAGATLVVGTYDLAAHDALLRYLRLELRLAQNSIYTLAKNLRCLFRYLRDERGQTLALDPARLGVPSVEIDVLHLSAADLAALAVALLPSSLAPVRDVFLFCCYTGLRYSDVHQLHGGNLAELPASAGGGRVLRLTQTKTRTSVSIYLTSLAGALLDKYACEERSGTGARLLPVLANQVMNRYLKRIARLAGITRSVEVVEVRGGEVMKTATPVCELVTMHTARHTFAVQSLMRGMPVAVLQRVMGHAKITTTMIYAKVVEDFQHHEMRRVWQGPVSGTMAADSTGAGAGICEVAPAA